MAFLTTLGLEEGILGAVDINPHKQGTFLAGTGLPIISPSELKDSSPDSVIVMNPIYDEEIRADLSRMHLEPEVLHIDQDPDRRLN